MHSLWYPVEHQPNLPVPFLDIVLLKVPDEVLWAAYSASIVSAPVNSNCTTLALCKVVSVL
jgi:hypothetical protein